MSATRCTCAGLAFTATGHGTELVLTPVVVDPWCPVHATTNPEVKP